MAYRDYSHLQVDQLIELYQSGLSYRQIGKITNSSSYAVQRRLSAVGIETRATGEQTRLSNSWFDTRKYSCNDRFFDIIDNEEKAYWLGFLLADGCVRSNRDTLTINLKKSDHPHLQKFLDSVESNHVIGFHKQGKHPEPNCSITITSHRMIPALRAKGIIAGRKMPVIIRPDLERHYWRGCVDGDGTIAFSKAKRAGGDTKYYSCVSLVGTKETVFRFRAFARRVINSSANPVQVKKVWNIKYHGVAAKALASFLYNHSSVFLDRKMEKFKWCIEHCQ